MFDKFGEFDSVEELNMAAEGLREEGDKDSLIALANENGIDPSEVEDFMDGLMDELANPLMAAVGKLEIEKESLVVKEIVEDWYQYIVTSCGESDEMARAVRKKGKSLKGCIAELLKWSVKNCYAVDTEITKAAGVSAGVKMGIPGMGRAKEIIREYYLGKQAS